MPDEPEVNQEPAAQAQEAQAVPVLDPKDKPPPKDVYPPGHKTC